MRARTSHRHGIAVAAVGLAAVGWATHAGAADLTISGSDGAPLPLVAGQVVETGNIAPQLGVAIAPRTENITLAVSGPDGAAVTTTANCYGIPFTRHIDYRGNGTYSATLTRYAANDYSCATPLGTETLAFTITGATGLGALPPRVLTRRPGGGAHPTFTLPVSAAAGAVTTEIRYAAGATLGSDGGITGSSETAYFDRTSGTTSLRFSRPGRYTVVARSRGAGANPFFTPWSAPVTVQAQVPFELLSLSYPDSRGPHYRLRGTVRDPSIRGRVVISMARGARGGRFRTIGRPTIRGNGTITQAFTQRTPGVYRIRFTHRGSPTVAASSVTYRMRITRTISYRYR